MRTHPTIALGIPCIRVVSMVLNRCPVVLMQHPTNYPILKGLWVPSVLVLLKDLYLGNQNVLPLRCWLCRYQTKGQFDEEWWIRKFRVVQRAVVVASSMGIDGHVVCSKSTHCYMYRWGAGVVLRCIGTVSWSIDRFKFICIIFLLCCCVLAKSLLAAFHSSKTNPSRCAATTSPKKKMEVPVLWYCTLYTGTKERSTGVYVYDFDILIIQIHVCVLYL